MSDSPPRRATDCFLEGYFDESGKRIRIQLNVLPSRVGRGEGQEITLPFPSVSSIHAEFYLENERVFVRDLGSTNGTFVNRERVDEPQAVRDGDVIHFGQHELRFVRSPVRPAEATFHVDLRKTNLPSRLVTGIRELAELMEQVSVEPHFQPVIDLVDGARVGYEVLARGSHPSLPSAPPELFRIAAEAGREADLSVLFRDRGFEVGLGLPGSPALYLNTHPKELEEIDRLVGTLVRLREMAPERPLVLEIHEAAVLGPQQMERLKQHLEHLGIGLAYDDFGAGQARLAELLETPPDILKFDLGIVRDLHRASPAKQQMVGTLVNMLVDQGIQCLAECVECQEEASVCRELGFNLAQGYFYGRPEPLQRVEG